MISRRQFFKRAIQTVGVIAASSIVPDCIEKYFDKQITGTLEATIKYPGGEWKHIAISRSLKDMKFYINGYEVTENAFRNDAPDIHFPETINKKTIRVEDILKRPFTHHSKDNLLHLQELRVQDFS